MVAPVPVEVLGTPDSVTTAQVLTTSAGTAAGEELLVFYGSDFGTLADMPHPTCPGETLQLLVESGIEGPVAHARIYRMPVTTPGAKAVTIPAHNGGDIHGHVLRYSAALTVDDSDTASNTLTVNPHVLPAMTALDVDRSYVGFWVVAQGPAHTGDAYVPQVSMTHVSETSAPAFSSSMVARESIAASGSTGTRSASWEPDGVPTLKPFAAAGVLVAFADAGFPTGEVSIPVTVGADVDGAKAAAGAVSVPVVVDASVLGVDLQAAPASAVLCSAWATESDVPEPIKVELGLDSEQWSRALMIASEILWALSGRRWYGGGCLEEAYLRSTPPRPGTGSWPYHRSWGDCGCWAGASWVNGYPVSAFLGEWRHIGDVYAVRLPRDTVTEIVSVTVNGDPFTSYNLTRSGWLERLDGGSWDVCSGSTVVTYRHGEPPPLGGVQAAVTLGVELARDMYDLGKCKLPRRVSTVARQGVTADIVDSLDILKEGGTGLTLVDLWLRSVNPEARPQRAGVWSPDLPRMMPRRPL